MEAEMLVEKIEILPTSRPILNLEVTDSVESTRVQIASTQALDPYAKTNWLARV
jgi:hypothetical protein